LFETKWVEVDTSYKDGHDSTEKSMDMMYKYAEEEVDAIIPVGGWSMWDDRWAGFVNANRNIMLVVGDTLQSQMDLMNRGYVNGLVGQLPFEMGSQSMDVLLQIMQGEEVETTIHGTAFLEVVRFPLILPDPNIE
jgi:ABC-type sugar transport system substrate-binding protein